MQISDLCEKGGFENVCTMSILVVYHTYFTIKKHFLSPAWPALTTTSMALTVFPQQCGC